MMRPSSPAPTGTEIGAPVSVTSWPRTRPSLVSMATVRTVDFAEMLGDFEHQAVALVRGLQRVEDRRQMVVECTSTTAPMTWVMCPTVLAIMVPRVLTSVAYSASAPEMISISSLVIIAWRVRL